MVSPNFADGTSCYDCGMARCECDDSTWDPLAGTLDGRDFTKEPPVMLDPQWVINMRARVNRYIQTGEWIESE